MSITLEQSRKIGQEIRLSGVHLTAHLAAINGLYTPKESESANELKAAKNLIESHIQAMLAGASMIKSGATDPTNPTEEESKEARRKIWQSIRQVTSKQGFFFVDGERPKAFKGKNWLVAWSVPQPTGKTEDDGQDHTPESPNATTESVTAVEIPSPTELSSAEKLLQIESLLYGLDLKDLAGLKRYIGKIMKEKVVESTAKYEDDNGLSKAA